MVLGGAATSSLSGTEGNYRLNGGPLPDAHFINQRTSVFSKRQSMTGKRLLTAMAALSILVALVFVYVNYPISPQPQGTVEIDLTAKQWFFEATLVSSTDPNASATTIHTSTSFANTTIVVRKGDLLIIHLRTGDVPHGFAINGYPDVGPYEVTPGQTVTFRFTANQAGLFIFYCTVFCGPGHPNHKGTLMVLP